MKLASVVKIINITLPCIVLVGAVAVCVLLQMVLRPPFVVDTYLAVLIAVFTNGSYFTSGIVSFVIAIKKRMVWLRNFQIAVNCVLAIAGLTAFLAYRNSIYQPNPSECRDTSTNTTTSCQCRQRHAERSCQDVYYTQKLVNDLDIVFVAELFFCFVDLLKAFMIPPTKDEENNPKNQPRIEQSGGSAEFYSIPYPEEWLGR